MNTRYRTAHIIALFLTFHAVGAVLQAQELISTRGDGSYFGRVLESRKDSTSIEFSDGVTMRISTASIERIESQRPSFYSLGVTLIMPGALNLNAGYMSNGWGLRAAAGTGFDNATYGVQLNLVRSLSRGKSFSSNVSLGIVHTQSREKITYYFGPDFYVDRTWTGAGGYLDLNWSGFFLEGGITVGHGSYTSPQLSIQLGYVYQFQWQDWIR